MVNSSRSTCDLTDRLLADRGGHGDAFVTEPISGECALHENFCRTFTVTNND